MPPSELIKLTSSEDTFIAEMMKGRKDDPGVLIPDDMDAREAIAAIRSCANMLVKLDRATGWLAPVLGRLMALAARNPEIYEKAGYDTLNAFEQAELIGKGISHGTLWVAKKVYEVFPTLPVEDYAKIGSTKLAIASRACKDASPAQKKKILAVAADKPVEEFRDFIEQKSGLSEKGDTSGGTFSLNGSAAQVGELKTWLADQGFRDWAGTDHPLGMVLAAIQESTSQFTSPASPESDEPIQSGEDAAEGNW